MCVKQTGGRVPPRPGRITAMKEHTGSSPTASKVAWANLHEHARLQVQQFIQSLLDEEITELLGRAKSERRDEKARSETEPVYRNGYGKPRQLTTPMGTLTVRRPRVRGLEERFESAILPLFRRRTPEVDALLPELYLHGLAEGDFDQALRALLGKGAPISASSVARLKGAWQQQYEEWGNRSLAELEVVYLWVDGIYVKAGLEKEKAALLVAVAGLVDGSKVVVAIKAGARESTESWSELLRKLKEKGLNCPRLVIGDGHLGIWGALRNVFPEAEEQRCWNHRILNILDKVPKKGQTQAKIWLRQIMYAETREEAEALKAKFQRWCTQRGWGEAGKLLDHDWERLVAYYDFPKAHWKHLRTTNPVESPFAAVRLRTTAAKRYKKVENATAVLWKLLMLAERNFRRLNGHHLLGEVAAGVKFKNGERQRELGRAAA